MLPVLTSSGVVGIGRGVAKALQLGRVAPNGDLAVLARGFASLNTKGSREAFLHTVRSVIDPSGQRVSARDRLHLAAVLPTLIVWGERDSIIPPPTAKRHTRRCPRVASRCSRAPATCPTTTIRSASPTILADFCTSTEPARLTTDHWRPLL